MIECSLAWDVAVCEGGFCLFIFKSILTHHLTMKTTLEGNAQSMTMNAERTMKRMTRTAMMALKRSSLLSKMDG